MQMFGTEGSEKPKVVVGNQEIKVQKASKLAEGEHLVRFWPLSPDFYNGGDFVSIVQHVHWLNKRPCICRSESYDWTVPDNQPKEHPDSHCPICNDKFVWFKKAKAIKEAHPTDPVHLAEAERLRGIGLDLMEKVSAASIVSLLDGNGNLSAPVVLRYGKELLGRIQLVASRIIESSGVHICDPAKGYMFEIAIGKKKGGYRTYEDSMAAVNTNAVDITGAPWDWKEVCAAIKPEIMPILTADEVMAFYEANYGDSAQSSQQEFSHSSFNNQAGTKQQNHIAQDNSPDTFTPPSNEESNVTGFSAPGAEEVKKEEPVNQEVAATAEPTFVSPAKEEVKKEEPVQSQPVQAQSTPLPPCHGSQQNTDGYDATDATCKACPKAHAKSCYAATMARSNSAPAETVSSAQQHNAVDSAPSFEKGSVADKLGQLNSRIENNGQ